MEARSVAVPHLEHALAQADNGPRPVCVISSGETTVHVTGSGKGGRNQEFALAASPLLAAVDAPVALASAGTDGVDGPTDAAGAIVDRTKEHLGYSDTVISRLRARMLQAVRHVMETGEVAELDPSIPYDRVAGAEGTIPVDAPWESVGAFAGEHVPELTPTS